jgi:hypothetical protein
MFRALLAHPQEALHKRHLVYCVRVMSVGCIRNGVERHTRVNMLTRVWQELEYRIDVCRVTRGAHIEHL